ncbi:MAG: xanthine dehydrogenase family protein subunit M [Desulfurococcaceae archaeon]
MYRIPEFKYFKVTSLGEALELLSNLDDARILAGGTDLVLDMKTNRCRPKFVIDIGGLSELRYIKDIDGALHIGSLTTIQEIYDSPLVSAKLPLLKRASEEFAYWQVRNMATIGGNLCNASPAADTAPPLLVHEAVVKVRSVNGERLIPLEDFFRGPRVTALNRDEILVEVIVPYKSLEGGGFSYIKVGRRRGHDISIVAVATAVRLSYDIISDIRLALNSVAPKPIRSRSVEGKLIGQKAILEKFEEASWSVENDISPITDVRAPAEYRRYMARLLVKETLLEATKSLSRGESICM